MIPITGNTVVDAALFIGVLVVSVILHEVAHGVVADWLGDKTARNAGRLTLNPVSHIDPFGSVLLPALLAFSGQPLFGWAKPVPVQPRNLSNPTTGMALVGVAGPATNLVLAFAGGQLLERTSGTVQLVIFSFVLINVVLAVFNMLPIPPLDGSRLLLLVLPPSGRRLIQQIEPYGIMILFVLLFVLGRRGGLAFLSPVINFVLDLVTPG